MVKVFFNRLKRRIHILGFRNRIIPMHVSGLLLAFVLAVSAGGILREEFDQWKLAHGKVYATEEEHELRFSNFVVGAA
jgi:hypothetical protein